MNKRSRGGLVGAVTSFVKQLPALAAYEYGFRVILFTFCLIIVSGYRVENPVATALDRLYSIAMGTALALLINVLVFPAWAGEQLHRELVGSFAAVADTLDGADISDQYVISLPFTKHIIYYTRIKLGNHLWSENWLFLYC